MEQNDHQSRRSVSPEQDEASANSTCQAEGSISPASSVRSRSMERDSMMVVSVAPTSPTHSELSPISDEGKDNIVPASITQIDNERQESFYHRIFYDSWTPELVAMLFSVMCLVALVGLLIAYQNERLDKFKSALSINTVVVILSTAARTSLAFVVTSALGQAKWCWVARKSQQLKDLQDLDAASRGPFDSLLLLFTNKSTTLSISSFGALILIFTLAIDPFSQQAVTTPLRLRRSNSTAATLKTSTEYPLVTSGKIGMNGISRLLQNSIWNGAIDLDYTCPSGDCIWPEYEYVGWCSECEVVQNPPYTSGCSVSVRGENVSALLNAPKLLPCDFTLEYSENTTWSSYVGVGTQGGRDLFINTPTSFITSLYGDPSDYDSTRRDGRASVKYNVSVDGGWFETPYKDGMLAGMLNPRKTYTAASIEWTIDQEEFVLHGDITEVTECGLTPCLKRIQAETRNATIYSTIKSKKLLASYYPRWIGNYLNPNDLPQYFCFRNFSDPPPDYDFGTPSPVQWDNGSYKNTLSDKQNRTFCVGTFSGWWEYNSPLDQALLGNSTAYSISWPPTGIVEQPFKIRESIPREDGSSTTYTLLNEGQGLESALHNITTAMDAAGLGYSNDFVTGEMSENTIIIVVRWQWLTLPIVLELLCIVFFSMVMAQTRQRGVRLWKTSVLPFCLGGLESDSAPESEDVPQPRTALQLHHLAELTRVSLKQSGAEGEEGAQHDHTTGEGP